MDQRRAKRSIKIINYTYNKYEVAKETLATKFPLDCDDMIFLIDKFLKDLKSIEDAIINDLIPVYEMNQLEDIIKEALDPNAQQVKPVDFISF